MEADPPFVLFCSLLGSFSGHASFASQMVNLLTATVGNCCLLMRLLRCLRLHCRSDSCWKHRLLETLSIVEPGSFANTTCGHLSDVWQTSHRPSWARRTPLHLHGGRGFASEAAVSPPQAEISAAMWEQLQQMQERHELLHRQLTGKSCLQFAARIGSGSLPPLALWPILRRLALLEHRAASSMLTPSITHVQVWRQLSWTTRRQPG